MKVLVFAPHNDDEVLGVGGTIAKYSKEGHEVYICEVTGVDDNEVTKQIWRESKQAHDLLGVKETIYLGLPVVELRHTPVELINRLVQEVVQRIKPEIAFIPHKGDMHSDHAVVSESAMVALRPHSNPQLKSIYAYETLSETEWNIPSVENAFIPNVWNNIKDTLDIKVEAMNCYKSQLQKFPHPRSLKAIEALAKFRGSTICVEYAEAFMLIRSIL